MKVRETALKVAWRGSESGLKVPGKCKKVGNNPESASEKRKYPDVKRKGLWFKIRTVFL